MSRGNQKQNIEHLISLCFDYQYISKNTTVINSLMQSTIVTSNSGGAFAEVLPIIGQIFEIQGEKEQFKQYCKATSPIIRNFKNLDWNISISCLKSMAKSLRYFAEYAEYNEAVSQMQKLLPLSKMYQNKSTGESALLYVCNELMYVFFLRNYFLQAQNVLGGIGDNIDFSVYPNNEVVEFMFNRGKINAIYSKLGPAQKDLLYAFHHTPFIEKNNRRLILAYLVPVQMCLGQLPTLDLINKYNLGMYQYLSLAIQQGNLALYDESLESNQFLFIKLGLFDLVIKARQLVFLQILKAVHSTWGDSKVPTTLFHEAISKHGEFDFLHAETIIASLIKNGFVKAYMSHPLQKIAFSQANPFPTIEPPAEGQ